MERTLIKETISKIGSDILVKGRVLVRRDHGKIVFIDLEDMTGVLQVVGGAELSELRPQYVIEIEGKVNLRPEKMINDKIPTGKVELALTKVNILEKSAELPFDMGDADLNLELPTLLDHRALSLRHAKQKAIFRVQANIADAFRKASEDLGCIEVFTPTISASATEGGAEVFKVDYYGNNAYLVQSPQLYKQIMVGIYERVYLFSHAYRSEPSVTTRHLSEVVQMDCEIGFIESFDELTGFMEFVGVETVKNAAVKSEAEFIMYGVPFPMVPNKVPRLTLREAQEVIAKKTGQKRRYDPDLTPDDEKVICEWAQKERKSDFVTITRFPTKKRAFYTMPDPKDPEFSLSYDLLFRGLEICSGSQRVNDYDQLISIMKGRDLDPENFKMYLQAFKYGIPPEGGFSYGLERMTMKLLGLANVREASLFPRDMERVDFRFSAKDTFDKQ